MKKIELDIRKVEKQLKASGKTFSWLADKIGFSRQRLHYHLKNKTVKGAEVIAPVFNLDPKDLTR